MRIETRRDSGGFLRMAGEVLEKGARLRFRAEGASMAPFILDGEEVLVEAIRHPVRLGEVVLISNNGRRPLLHRTVAIGNRGVVTRGDGSRTDDRDTPFDGILGRVTKVSSRGLSFHLRSPFRQMVACRNIFPLSLLEAGPGRRVGRFILSLLRECS